MACQTPCSRLVSLFAWCARGGELSNEWPRTARHLWPHHPGGLGVVLNYPQKSSRESSSPLHGDAAQRFLNTLMSITSRASRSHDRQLTPSSPSPRHLYPPPLSSSVSPISAAIDVFKHEKQILFGCAAFSPT